MVSLASAVSQYIPQPLSLSILHSLSQSLECSTGDPLVPNVSKWCNRERSNLTL